MIPPAFFRTRKLGFLAKDPDSAALHAGYVAVIVIVDPAQAVDDVLGVTGDGARVIDDTRDVIYDTRDVIDDTRSVIDDARNVIDDARELDR